MALKLRAKDIKKKTVVKKPSKKKVDKKDPYLHSNYADVSEIKHVEITQPINRLKYAHVLYYNLDLVNVNGDIIKLNNGWIELIMIMLDTIRANYKDDFIGYLMENKITTQSFCVDTKYGKYTFDEEGYRAFKLYNSEYYVEAIFNVENIFQTIVKLTKCLGISPENILFKMINKDYNIETVKFQELEEESIKVNIKDSLPYFNKGTFLMHIKITNSIMNLDKEQEEVSSSIHNIQSVLYVFINYVYNTYSDSGIKKLAVIKGETHVAFEYEDNDKPCKKINNTNYLLYTDCEPKSIINFIDKSMNMLGMDKSDIVLYFKRLKTKEEKKEWEVD